MFFILFLASSVTAIDSRHDLCKKPSVTWNSDYAYKFVINIGSYEECAQLCRTKEAGCNYFTWFDQNYPYFRNSCALYKDAYGTEECQHCISGAASCFCEKPYACKDTGDDVAYVHIGVSSWGACEVLCNTNRACSNFTWFTEEHPHKHLCVLYKGCSQADTEPCSGCCSGVKTKPSPCSQGYKELTSAHRSINSEGGTYRDMPITGSWRNRESYNTSLDWAGNGWYRFTGEAGTKMATNFPGYNKCGTDYPGYLKIDSKNQTLPTENEGEKTMTVCFGAEWNEYTRNTCSKKIDVKVLNCKDYFIYHLHFNIGYYNIGTYCGAT